MSEKEFTRFCNYVEIAKANLKMAWDYQQDRIEKIGALILKKDQQIGKLESRIEELEALAKIRGEENE